MSWLKLFGLFASLSILLGNCPTRPPFDSELGESVVSLHAPEIGRHLFWSTDGDLIFVGAQGFFRINAADGNAQQILSITSLPSSPLFASIYIPDAELVEADNEQQIYFYVDERQEGFRHPKGRLYQFSPTNANATATPVLSDITGFEVSEDGSKIAFVRSGDENLSDSLFIYDVATKATDFLTLGFPVAFSPSGDSLLVDAPEQELQLSVFALDDKNEIAVNFDSDAVFRRREISTQWDNALPDFVYANNRSRVEKTMGSLLRWEGNSQSSKELWQLPEEESFGLTLPIQWSRDRRNIAKWTDRCYRSGGFTCFFRRYSLWIIDNGTGSAKSIARSANEGSVLAFSPDGSRLAYAVVSRRRGIAIASIFMEPLNGN